MSRVRPDLVRKTSADWISDAYHRNPPRRDVPHKGGQVEAIVRVQSHQNYPPTQRPVKREAGPRQDAFDLCFSLKDVLDMSPSSFTLREVLDRAPGLGSDGDQNVDIVQHWPSGDKHAYWTNPYYTEVFQALIGVIREHGITGWKDAQWTVHDAYHQSMGMVRMQESIYGSAWVEDDGRGWIKERIALDQQPPFMFNPAKNPPPIWKEYAALLNILIKVV
ncbi:hypothetical protein FA13DRAFT_1811097 [Coprinellus micaceus]|uniref:Uncharacterized protein n=1 Tax=Coprinellus micaceus TaxID=71717 RepID=A0A4Y7TMF0_COPMI|nr:hypothetical protein FA13DRAFT_1811097 [Coprinellus micaceus]